MTTQSIKLDDIIADNGVQARTRLRDDFVSSYAQDMKSGDEFPPVVVFRNGREIWLADGFHRHEGARAAGLSQIDCDVRKGSKLDAIAFAAGCNLKQGLGRTNADKRRAVEQLLKLRLEHPEFQQQFKSERAIAKHCGVSHTMVQNLREAAGNKRGRKNRPKVATVAKTKGSGPKSASSVATGITPTPSEKRPWQSVDTVPTCLATE